MLTPNDLYGTPNALVKHYSKFRVTERIMLTGHSHQAWPDCGLEGQQKAWFDAAQFVDEKWERAFAVAERVREGYRKLLDDTDGHITLGQNTHELVTRFLSALPLKKRPRIITTDGEFHTIRRQLDRLAEEGLEIVKVSSHPSTTIAERLSAAVNNGTAVVMVSTVLFQNAHIVPGIGDVLSACKNCGAELLLDVYHMLNVVPFSLKKQKLYEAYVVGGGYKYCQLGEGNCFLRFPSDCKLRPVVTGWFSEFGVLAAAKQDNRVLYGEGPARFDGATYDPTSHYRAAEVFDFFKEQGLNVNFLRIVSQHQIGLLARLFDEMDIDPHIMTRDRAMPLSGIGGFLALQTPHAHQICQLLREKNVHTDYRGNILRLGPAPYLSDTQLEDAMQTLKSIVKSNRSMP